jgi:GntR family transcriptional regulator, vanillate catabolism transcriptional regulator
MKPLLVKRRSYASIACNLLVTNGLSAPLCAAAMALRRLPHDWGRSGSDGWAMAPRSDTVTTRLRELILAGDLDPGARLTELPFAKRLGVSRTPLRIALGELEKEGLLERLPTRGFKVREFPMEQKAIDVRGVLEGMAARIVAERGVDAATRRELDQRLAEGRELTHIPPGGIIDPMRWAAMHARFHWAIVRAARNPALAAALEHNERSPMAAAATITFSRLGGEVACQQLPADGA